MECLWTLLYVSVNVALELGRGTVENITYQIRQRHAFGEI